MGRLTTVEVVDDLIRSLEAIKLLFRPRDSFKRPESDEAAQ
jgi:hypothetical protein